MPNIDEMPKVGNIINESSSFLSSEGIQESIGKTKWLLSSLFNLSTTEIDLDHDRNLTAKELEKFNGWLSRCAEGEPVQYITNETDFFSLTFHLNKDVLIPRAETERLVEIAIEHVNNSHIQSVLDIGTGCGCIAISLAKNCEHLSIMAIDKSKDALKLANRNSCLNCVNNRIDFFQLNILTQNPVKKFDLVVTNPPYISINEYRCLDKTIKLFEPRNALTDEFDGLRFYRRISEKGMSWLKPGGTILMEVGRGKHPEMAAELFSSENWGGIKIFSDYNGDNRILKVSRI